jgi:hypothetical protein
MRPVDRDCRPASKLRKFAGAGSSHRVHLEKTLLRMQEAQGSHQIRQIPSGKCWHTGFVPRDFNRALKPRECSLPFQDWNAIRNDTPKPKPKEGEKQNRRRRNTRNDPP